MYTDDFENGGYFFFLGGGVKYKIHSWVFLGIFRGGQGIVLIVCPAVLRGGCFMGLTIGLFEHTKRKR
jgi:hypothetical protein